MGPTRGPSGANRTQVGPHVGPMNFAIWAYHKLTGRCSCLQTVVRLNKLLYMFDINIIHLHSAQQRTLTAPCWIPDYGWTVFVCSGLLKLLHDLWRVTIEAIYVGQNTGHRNMVDTCWALQITFSTQRPGSPKNKTQYKIASSKRKLGCASAMHLF